MVRIKSNKSSVPSVKVCVWDELGDVWDDLVWYGVGRGWGGHLLGENGTSHVPKG